ncbi:MAG: YdcF family protein [Methylococcales bacterium]|nr:YdcF family protein [Methylococcales bacterium]
MIQAWPTSWEERQEADCGVVLTGGPGRVREGFDALTRGEVQRLVISGVYEHAQLREIMPLWPFYGSLNEDQVVLDRRSGTTYGNAQQSLPLVEALRCRDILLITSKLHMYRALQTFQAVYPEELPIYPRAVIAGSLRPTWGEVINETTKSLFYSVWAY